VLIRKKLHFTNEMWHAAAHAQIGLVYYRFVKEKWTPQFTKYKSPVLLFHRSVRLNENLNMTSAIYFRIDLAK